MTHQTSHRLLLLAALVSLLIVAVSPLAAQDALTQTTQFAADGYTLTVAFPEGWAAKTSGPYLFLADSPAAVDTLDRTGRLDQPDDVGMVFNLPSYLKNLNLLPNAPADQALTAYLEQGKVTGDVQPSSDYSVPAAVAVVTPPNRSGEPVEVVVGALQFAAGTVIFGVVPASALDDTIRAILNSATLTSDETVVPGSVQDASTHTRQSVVGETTTLSVLMPTSTVDFAITLPPGWVQQYSQNSGILYLGNTDSALANASIPDPQFQAGDIAITIALPRAVGQLLRQTGTVSPEAVLSGFKEAFSARGLVQSDRSFDVPAVYAHLTGGTIPDGAGDVFALGFDAGTILAAVQPGDSVDDTVLGILQSIRFGGASQPPPQATSEATAQAQAIVGETTTLTVDQPEGAVDFSITLPPGWVQNYILNAGVLYLGNNDSALQNAPLNDPQFQSGDIALSVAMPKALAQVLGTTGVLTPQEALTQFKEFVQADGQVQADNTFDVPAVYAHLTGGKVPPDGADVFALGFDAGTILVIVQPGDRIDDIVRGIIQSIRLTAAPAPTLQPPPEATVQATVQATSEATAQPQSAETTRQWAVRADGSSEYGSDSWSFMQATGKPDTTECGDNTSAWASESSTGQEELRVYFAQPVIPSRIDIYQTYNPGSIVGVDVGSSANPDSLVSLPDSADAPGNTSCPGFFTVNVSGIDTPIDFVVIHLDQSIGGSWDEIDAVQLFGTPAS